MSLSFPEIGKEVSGEDIYNESLRLSEKLIDKQSMEFVGCIASMFKISVHGLNYDIKGKKITVRIWTDGTEEEPVTLFNGIVDSAVSQSNRWNKEITAYDELYTLGNTEVAASVAARIADEINAEYFSFYRRVDYEEFEVKVIDKVTVRQSEDDPGVTYGSGTNNYIVQGNIFAYGLSNQEFTAIAKNIYNSIGGFSYYPFQSENNGLPFIECGVDAVSYYVVNWEKTMGGQKARSGDIVYEQRPFYVLNRELSGIQALKDSYSAKGEEYQSEFVTDLQTQIDLIKKNQGADKSYVENYVGNYTYDKGMIDDMFANFDPGTGGGFNVESVAALPSNPDPNTIYLIQGVVVVE